jgi:DNA-binding response OmpR family regulator
MPKRRLLCVSFDRMVSENRQATLKEAGYDVTATTSVKEALELLSRERFDGVIVGHRFPVEEKYVLAADAKEKSNTPVLLVCGAARDSEIPATSRVYALEGSAGLLSALSALFPAEAETRSQAAA